MHLQTCPRVTWTLQQEVGEVLGAHGLLGLAGILHPHDLSHIHTIIAHVACIHRGYIGDHPP